MQAESVKTCHRCKEAKASAMFASDRSRKDGLRSACRPCEKVKRREWYLRDPAEQVRKTMRWRAKNLDKARRHGLDQRRRLKQQVFQAYGARCTCCGETHQDFLTVEHVNGGGRRHLVVRGTTGIYRDIIKAGFPSEYTILCMNCNFASRLGRTCPHAAGGSPKTAELVEALKKLVDEIDAATPAMKSMALMSHVHGAPYNGPTIDVEAARAVLMKVDGR